MVPKAGLNVLKTRITLFLPRKFYAVGPIYAVYFIPYGAARYVIKLIA